MNFANRTAVVTGGSRGIGLAIAQSVTEHYNGSLRAYNEDGAVFEVRFPKSP